MQCRAEVGFQDLSTFKKIVEEVVLFALNFVYLNGVDENDLSKSRTHDFWLCTSMTYHQVFEAADQPRHTNHTTCTTTHQTLRRTLLGSFKNYIGPTEERQLYHIRGQDGVN